MISIGQAHKTCKSVIEFRPAFEVLGPFEIGTRELVWGADPLERIGGFRALSYDDTATFDSSLGSNGSVQWQKVVSESVSNTERSAKATLSLTFQTLDVEFTSTVYGWAALQYQAWARGWLVNHASTPQTVEFFTDGVWEYSVNQQSIFGGDMYGLRKAPPVLTLNPGSNKIDLRIYRDIRAFGGLRNTPTVIDLEARTMNTTLLVEDSILISDKVDGKLPSPYASLVVRNLGLQKIEIESVDPLQGLIDANILNSRRVLVYPGQSRPVGLVLQLKEANVSTVVMIVKWKSLGARKVRSSTESLIVEVELKAGFIREPHKVTFLNRGGSVSYAILRPPAYLQSPLEKPETMPVMLNLHGAGVDVESAQLRHSLDEVPDLEVWVLFPQGGSLWSGDDFHTWGFADVRAAIDSIPAWIQTMEWSGPGVNTQQWMICGHSNGGQGSWFGILHYPDNVIGGAPISAYTSIENYVPYIFGYKLEPFLSAVLHSSMNGFKNELLIENLPGIPLVAQHGSSDDNVPVYHSRLMKALAHAFQAPLQYVEVPGAGHWFEGVMTTEPLQAFYHAILNARSLKPLLPIDFTLVVTDSDDFGSRGGLAVDQVESPSRLARIRTHRNVSRATWQLQLSNIHRFHFNPSAITVPKPRYLLLDGKQEVLVTDLDEIMFFRAKNGTWDVVHDDSWKNQGQRYGRQRGALEAILRTTDHFRLLYSSANELAIALQISRNLFQYYAADSELVNRNEPTISSRQGNSIVICLGSHCARGCWSTHPAIQIGEQSICLKGSGIQRDHCYAFEAGLGAIFLQPVEDEGLELLVWGNDLDGLQQAARLVPTLTGVGIPDFVIVTAQCRWQGAAGAAAAGFLGYDWQISAESYMI